MKYFYFKGRFIIYQRGGSGRNFRSKRTRSSKKYHILGPRTHFDDQKWYSGNFQKVFAPPPTHTHARQAIRPINGSVKQIKHAYRGMSTDVRNRIRHRIRIRFLVEMKLYKTWITQSHRLNLFYNVKANYGHISYAYTIYDMKYLQCKAMSKKMP